MTVYPKTYHALESRWKSMRGEVDVAIREVACVNASRTLLCVELGDTAQPRVALAAGVHGDEPAGVYALLRLIETNALDRRYSYRIWPCTNPTGFDAATRANIDGVDINRTFARGGSSPESAAIVMSNRDRKFVLSIDLHEDCDAAGFYCYEYGGGTLGRAAIAAVSETGFPIEPLETLNLGSPLLEQSIRRERGRVIADPFQEANVIAGMSYSLLLARNASRHTLTCETPVNDALERRIDAHSIAVCAAIAQLAQASNK